MNKRTKLGSTRIGPAQKRVVILGLTPVDALDVIGPAEVFALANKMHTGETAPYALELVSAGTDVYLESETGIGLRGHRTLADERRASRPIDTLIVATGTGSLEHLDSTAIDWLRVRAKTIRRVCSICVGAFALAEAGLLDGRRAGHARSGGPGRRGEEPEQRRGQQRRREQTVGQEAAGGRGGGHVSRGTWPGRS